MKSRHQSDNPADQLEELREIGAAITALADLMREDNLRRRSPDEDPFLSDERQAGLGVALGCMGLRLDTLADRLEPTRQHGGDHE